MIDAALAELTRSWAPGPRAPAVGRARPATTAPTPPAGRFTGRSGRRATQASATGPATPGIGLHTPADVHHGRAQAIAAARAGVLHLAHAAQPRTARPQGAQPPKLPDTVWINKPPADDHPEETTH